MSSTRMRIKIWPISFRDVQSVFTLEPGHAHSSPYLPSPFEMSVLTNTPGGEGEQVTQEVSFEIGGVGFGMGAQEGHEAIVE